MGFLDVLAAMLWVSGGAMLAVVAARVLRDPNPGAVGGFTRSPRVLGPLVLAPAAVAVLDHIAARISGGEPPPEAAGPIPEVITLGPPLEEAQTCS